MKFLTAVKFLARMDADQTEFTDARLAKIEEAEAVISEATGVAPEMIAMMNFTGEETVESIKEMVA